MSLEDLLFLAVFVAIALVNGLRARRTARRARAPECDVGTPEPAARPDTGELPTASPPDVASSVPAALATVPEPSTAWGPPPLESLPVGTRPELSRADARPPGFRGTLRPRRLTPRSARDAIVLSTILGPCRARDDQSA